MKQALPEGIISLANLNFFFLATAAPLQQAGSPMSSDDSDTPFDAWLAQARAGDREAMGRLLAMFHSFLVREAEQQVRASARSKCSSSDLVQMTYLEAVRQLDAFQGRSPAELAAWLRTILVHNTCDQSRHLERQARDVRREQPMALDRAGSTELPSASTLPPARAMRQEEYAQLDEAIRRLPADDQWVLLARYRDQWTFAQIAAHLGITENAARKRWVRALAHLRKALQRP